jgi:tyrosinase
MRTRSLADPRSWRYQAAIHAYHRPSDPLASPADVLPSAAQQQRFWNQCQHFSWFFLPWHRMYLLCFEQAVQTAIDEVGGGPGDWALPYWNYSSGAESRRLPLAFRLPTMPDGSANPLRVEQRLRGNDGAIVATANQASVQACLVEPRFDAPSVGGLAGFGGPQTGFNHSGSVGAPLGKLEATPHGSMHVAVGHFMGAFATAGLDPMFWLHHCNIDRLWEVWRNRHPLHRDPTSPLWLSGVTFDLHDGLGSPVTFRAADVVNTAAPLLEYRYDDISDPIGGVAAAAPAAGGVAMAEQHPEMVGATQEPTVLTGGTSETRIAVSPPTGPAAAAAAAAAAPPTVHLNVENVTGFDSNSTYAVYINVPEGERAEDHPELFGGLVPTFGVPEATRGDAQHAGDGLTFSLDITEVARRLEARGEWGTDLRVTFVPEGMPLPPSVAAAAPPSPVRVGRVSVYFA